MFEDIRPYHDDEVATVIEKLINEKGLQTSIALFKVPTLYKIFPNLCRFLVKLSLKFSLKRFNKINDIQLEVAKYLHRLVKESSKGVSFSGLKEIESDKPILFISNHRDIILDCALVNLALYKCDKNTVEFAVGDNLLDQPWVSDLMRLNKSFIVKRSEKTKRAMLNASKQLSSYIHHALTENSQHIWIAQKEGRAKDGIDKTNAALISMLLLNKPKTTPIKEYLETLNIIPISISYEYDPCDKDKAIELAEIDATGSYQKAEDEDFRSITQGLIGEKGQIHIEFGAPIQGDYEDSKAIAKAIDEQIISHYKLYDSNLAAYDILQGNDISLEQAQIMNARMQGLSDEQKQWLLTMYANPVKAKKELPEHLSNVENVNKNIQAI